MKKALKKLVTSLVIWSLDTVRLDKEHKARVTAKLLDNIGAFPISDTVKLDTMGQLLVNGKKLDSDQATALRESAENMQHSFANNLIDQQLTFEAVKLGVYKGNDTDMIIFSKAALWYIQEKKKLLTTITNK